MKNSICIFGEVLFDHFPDGSQVLGGAPFNVAWHLQAFGLSPFFISRVGNDDEGRQVRDVMQAWGMDTAGLQTDYELPTGRVQVEFEDGEPGYEIVEDCAYDAIEPQDTGNFELLYHGSLALRSPASAATLLSLRTAIADRVFVDVNLRAPWWRRSRLETVLSASHWVKLNADELAALGTPEASPDDPALYFLEAHQLQGLVITRGAEGAEVLLSNGERFQVPGERVSDVVDTVGAGDAFSSVLLVGLARDWPIESTLQRAGEFAARLVGRQGATVQEREFYQEFIRKWDLSG
jgi:fructokinase